MYRNDFFCFMISAYNYKIKLNGEIISSKIKLDHHYVRITLKKRCDFCCVDADILIECCNEMIGHA